MLAATVAALLGIAPTACGGDPEPATVAVIVGLDAFGDVVAPLEAALVDAGVRGGVRVADIRLGLGPGRVAGPASIDRAVAEALALDPDVVVALTTPVVEAVLAADPDVAVVFGAVNDPVGVGLVDDLGAPGGRLTGVATSTGAASLDVLVRATGARRVGLVTVTGDPVAGSGADQVRGAVDATGASLVELAVDDPGQLDLVAVRRLLAEVDALLLPPAPFVVQVIGTLAAEAVAAGVPFGLSLAALRPLEGVVVAVAPDTHGLAQQLARRVVAILEGVPAGTIAIDPVDLEVSVDLDAAAAVGVEIPDLVLVEADRVFGRTPAP
ncbi:MAG TPA: ABC transporter substrate binding protein [Acidimicrobiales bacterium]|nr:ABC transporter substrate binding protein [Acidimicrobiales bacterium]